MKNRNFEDAVQDAPICDRWVAENPFSYIWHVFKNMPKSEWWAGVMFLTLTVGVLLFVLSR